MPKFQDLKCNSCEFTLKLSWGYPFVINDAGERLILPKYDQIEDFATEVLLSDGHDPVELVIPKGWVPRYSCWYLADGTSKTRNDFLDSRIGSYSTMMCKSCLKVIFIDLEKDTVACSHCNSDEVIEIDENISEMICPKCNVGQMMKHGRTSLA